MFHFFSSRKAECWCRYATDLLGDVTVSSINGRFVIDVVVWRLLIECLQRSLHTNVFLSFFLFT